MVPSRSLFDPCVLQRECGAFLLVDINSNSVVGSNSASSDSPDEEIDTEQDGRWLNRFRAIAFFLQVSANRISLYSRHVISLLSAHYNQTLVSNSILRLGIRHQVNPLILGRVNPRSGRASF